MYSSTVKGVVSLKAESRTPAIAAFLSVFLVATAPSFPAELEEEEGSLDDEFAFLEETAMVESAVRHSQPLPESPAAITLLTRRDIEASGARTLPELLREVPNMDVRMASPFWYDISVRGGRSAAGADNVLLLVDGRDVTLDIVGAQFWTAQHFSMDEVKRVEVIRGPGSALYGANAFAGVVGVFTLEPGEGPEASVSVRGGEHGQNEMGFRGTRRFGSLALAASAGLEREDFWTARDVDGRSLVRGRLAGKIDLGPQSSLLLESGAYQTSGRLRTAISEVEVGDLINVYGRARFIHKDLTVQAVYERLDFDAEFDLELILGGIPLIRLPNLSGHTDKVGLVAQHAFRWFHNRITYGADYSLNAYHARPFIPRDQYEQRVGAFIQDEVDIAAILEKLAGATVPGLTLTAGLRYDYNSFTRWEFSPRASLVCRPARDHSFRVGYAHAFLKARLFESRLHVEVIDISGLGLDIHELDWSDNPDLDNETIDSLEAGYLGSFLDGRLQLGLDLAYTWYRKHINFYTDESQIEYIHVGPISIPDINGPGFGVANNEYGHSGHTVAVRIVARPYESLRAFVNVGYRQIFDDEDRKFWKFEPIWHIGSGVDLAAAGGWSSSVRVFFTDSFESKEVTPGGGVLGERDSRRLPLALWINARVARRIVTGPVDLSVGLEGFNLLGNSFREHAGTVLSNNPDYGAERFDRRIVFFIHGRI